MPLVDARNLSLFIFPLVRGRNLAFMADIHRTDYTYFSVKCK